MKSKRQAMKQQRKRRQNLNRLLWGGLIVVALGIVGYVLFSRPQPATGEAVSVMPDTSHVQEGTDPGPYNSDPPTSGRHYANEMDAGFYNDGDKQVPYPAGYLVHNLEHGYVIFWYNCTVISDQECSDLKSSIKSVMDQVNNFKVIAYPWLSIDVPVVMTSWGRIQKFDNFDSKQAQAFVQANQNQAPEPNAP
jgi:hypothetical protein